nr:MAG TPA: protein of unknown function DUF2043 [Caudoviricetes sp.]
MFSCPFHGCFPRDAYFLSLWLPFFEATKRS